MIMVQAFPCSLPSFDPFPDASRKSAPDIAAAYNHGPFNSKLANFLNLLGNIRDDSRRNSFLAPILLKPRHCLRTMRRYFGLPRP